MGRAQNRQAAAKSIAQTTRVKRGTAAPRASKSASVGAQTENGVVLTKANPVQARKMRQARAACKALLAQGAEAVALFGSVAREEAVDDSDIDLLVVSEERLHRRELKLSETAPLGPAFVSWEGIQTPGAQQYAFLTLVASEAIMLHDPEGKLAKALTKMTAPDPDIVAADVARMAHRLDVYDHLGRFGGLYLHMFGDCYRYAKGAVIAASAYKGEPQTRRDDAFAWFIARHPERAEDVAILRTIEPHYLLTMNKGSTDDLPFPAQDCHELAQSVLDAAKRIIAAAYV